MNYTDEMLQAAADYANRTENLPPRSDDVELVRLAFLNSTDGLPLSSQAAFAIGYLAGLDTARTLVREVDPGCACDVNSGCRWANLRVVLGYTT